MFSEPAERPGGYRFRCTYFLIGPTQGWLVGPYTRPL